MKNVICDLNVFKIKSIEYSQGQIIWKSVGDKSGFSVNDAELVKKFLEEYIYSNIGGSVKYSFTKVKIVEDTEYQNIKLDWIPKFIRKEDFNNYISNSYTLSFEIEGMRFGC